MIFYNKVLAAIYVVTTCLTTHIVTGQGPPVFATSLQQQQKLSSSNVRLNTERIQAMQDNLKQISLDAEKYALDFWTNISNANTKQVSRSYMISPFAVWSLLLLLTEGAEGNTLVQLRKTLHLEQSDQTTVRNAYKQITKFLAINTTTIEVASFQALFTDMNKPVNRDYEDIIERDYGSALIPVDFQDVNNTFTRINEDIKVATRGLIPHTVAPQDLFEASLLMISTLYFKGQWRFPFDIANTRSLPFHDEQGKVLGNVQMMNQESNFLYVNMKELEGHVLELPYGKENRLSMLVILPRRGVTTNKVVNNLRSVGIAQIFQQLDEMARSYEYEEDKEQVEVYLPKFSTTTHLSLRPILTNMGIVDVFEPAFANLTKMSKNVFVSSIFHSTRIIVNEEGTEAAAVASAVLVNKASPVKFFLDRPFVYLIVEKTANLVLFVGEVKSPE